jgi:hypothetical protein
MSKSSVVYQSLRQQGLLASPSHHEDPNDSTNHHFYSVGPENNRDLHHIQAWLPLVDLILWQAVSHHLGGIKGVRSLGCRHRNHS